jgi:hypothetical protein
MFLYMPLICTYIIYAIKGTYAIKMYSNFTFNYINYRQRRKNETIKKEKRQPEYPRIILDIPMIMVMLIDWHGAWNRPRYLNLYIYIYCGERLWLYSHKLNGLMMRLYCTQALTLRFNLQYVSV